MGLVFASALIPPVPFLHTESAWVAWAPLPTTPQMAQMPCASVHVPHSSPNCMCLPLPSVQQASLESRERQNDIGLWLLQVGRVRRELAGLNAGIPRLS